MMRQSRGALGQLLRLQAARETHKPDTNTRNTAAPTEACPPPASTAEPPAPQPAPEDKSHSLTKAEEYALANPTAPH